MGFFEKLQRNVLWPYPLIKGKCCSQNLEIIFSTEKMASLFSMTFPCKNISDSDLIIIAGPIDDERAEQIEELKKKLSGKYWVMALGDCVMKKGHSLESNYLKLTDLIDVDIIIPGHPPTLEMIQKKMAHFFGKEKKE